MKNIGTFWDDPLCGLLDQSVRIKATNAIPRVKGYTLIQFFRVMKLTIFIMTLFLLQVSAATNAQITLNTKQESLLKVLDKISKQSGYDLIYTVQDFKNSNPVTIKLNNVSVEQALKEAFAGQPLVYEVSGTTMMVKRKEEKEASIIDRIKSYLASINIAGTVQDEKGIALPGVNVKIKGGKGNTLTGTKGEFALKNVEPGAIVEFTYVGYRKKELPAEEMMGFIRMELSDNKLDEVQVQFSGTTSRRNSTSNITTIKAEDIAKQPVDNPLYTLMGRVPGLIVTPSSGNFNSPVKIQLRGQNSLSTVDSEPLIVIDGVPYLNNIGGQSGAYTATISAMSFVNPADIESVDVLKDADATAIYGSRGANGVILITTKKGKVGPASIEASLSMGFSTAPTSRVKLMNTEQYLQMRREAFINDGLQVPDANIPGGEKNVSNFDLTVWDQNRYTDWVKEFTGGVGKNQQATINVSGGSEFVRYSLGGTYTKSGLPFLQDYADNKQQMGTGTFNISGNSLDRKFQASLSGTYSGNKSVSSGDLTSLAFTLAPNAPALFNSDGTLNWAPNPGTDVGEATWQNPIASLLRISTSKTNTINASANLAYDFTSNLKLSVVSGFNKVSSNVFGIVPIASLDPAFFSSNTGSTQTASTEMSNWSIQPQLNYQTTLSKGKLDFLIGGTIQYTETEDQVINASGFTSDALLGSWASASNLGISAANTSSQYKYAGAFLRINYNWDGKYIVNLNGRRDGSSRFGPGNQFGNFGSLGGAWIFTNESFLKETKSPLSFGKIRASFGTNGNDQIGNYKYLELFGSTNGGQYYQGQPLLVSSGATNPDYHWEHKSSLELGFDLGFFKDRLLISGSYFKAINADQLLTASLPITSGVSSGLFVNQSARIQNTGMELTLTSINFAGEKFGWKTTANISFGNRNKILKLPASQDYLQSRLGTIYDPAKPVEELIGKPFSGIVATYDFRGIDPQTGLATFADASGITTSDEVASYRFADIIDINPKFYGGISNQFSFKGITLDVFFEFKKQMGLNVHSIGINGFMGQPINMPIEFTDRWKQPGDNSSFQRASQNSSTAINGGLMRISNVAYSDASYLRLKNISMSYELPSKFLQKIHVRHLSIFANGQNVLTFTRYEGADPETQSWDMLPPLRTIQTGIRLGL